MKTKTAFHLSLIIAGLLVLSACSPEPKSHKSEEHDHGDHKTHSEKSEHEEKEHDHSSHEHSTKTLDDETKAKLTNTLCPVMAFKGTKEAIDPEQFVSHAGNKVYFCCKGCIKKFKKDPAKYLTALKNAGDGSKLRQGSSSK